MFCGRAKKHQHRSQSLIFARRTLTRVNFVKLSPLGQINGPPCTRYYTFLYIWSRDRLTEVNTRRRDLIEFLLRLNCKPLCGGKACEVRAVSVAGADLTYAMNRSTDETWWKGPWLLVLAPQRRLGGGGQAPRGLHFALT